MPTYELKCRDCERSFEVFVMRVLRDEDKVCPGCGSEDVSQGIGGGYFARTTSSTSSDAVAPSCSATGGTCSPRTRSAFG